jgi:hypothetical protein
MKNRAFLTLPVKPYRSNPTGQTLPVKSYRSNPAGQTLPVKPSYQTLPVKPYRSNPTGQTFLSNPNSQTLPVKPYRSNPTGQTLPVKPYWSNPTGQTLPVKSTGQIYRSNPTIKALHTGTPIHSNCSKYPNHPSQPIGGYYHSADDGDIVRGGGVARGQSEGVHVPQVRRLGFGIE